MFSGGAAILRPGWRCPFSFLFLLLFTKICVSKNPSLQLQVLPTFWQLLQWHFSIAIGRQMSPWTHQIFSSYFNLFSPPASPALSPPPFFLVRPLFFFFACCLSLSCCCSDEVEDWIRGVARCFEGGSISRSVAKQTPT